MDKYVASNRTKASTTCPVFSEFTIQAKAPHKDKIAKSLPFSLPQGYISAV